MTTATATADQNVLQEYVDNRGVALRVDREHGVISGVKLLGTVSARGREYPIDVIRKSAGLYEGKQVNVDHVDDGQRRSYRDRIGAIRNVQIREDGLYGDFHYNPKHVIAEQLAWDAEHAPGNVGFSHDARGPSKTRAGKTVVESIDKVLSVDLVANPATTAGLFESADLPPEPEVMDITKLTIAELRESRDDLVKAILAESADVAKRTQLEAEVKTLREELTGLKAKDAQRLLQETVAAELKAAKLDAANKTACSDLFVESLHAEPDAAKRHLLIEDRAKLVQAAGNRQPSSAAPQAAPPLQEAQSVPAGASLTERTRGWTK